MTQSRGGSDAGVDADADAVEDDDDNDKDDNDGNSAGTEIVDNTCDADGVSVTTPDTTS